MKNKVLASLLLVALVFAISSCATQKYGCPGNPQANFKFKG
jgi:hypothetical protein